MLYASLQAASGEAAFLGPLELGALVLCGMGWGRRQGRRSLSVEVIGLLLLAVAGAFGWLESPEVRRSLLDGHLLAAIGHHAPGWLAALAFWRGEAHRRSENEFIQDRLVGWAVPALAVPWLIGYASASGRVQDDFVAAAFFGTILFVGSALMALGLARLEALRLSEGADWRDDRSWLWTVLGLPLVVTILAVPLAAILGVSGRSVLAILVGPLETLILLVVTATAPIFLLAAVLVTLLHPFLPHDIRLEFHIPRLIEPGTRGGSDLVATILTVIVVSLFVFDAVALVVMAWIARGHRWKKDDPEHVFEERTTVIPPPEPRHPAPDSARRTHRPGIAEGATGAYLLALDALAQDGRWPRRDQETPAAHLARVRSEGLSTASFGRLTAAYQLERYASQPLPLREVTRARRRLNLLRSWLVRG